MDGVVLNIVSYFRNYDTIICMKTQIIILVVALVAGVVIVMFFKKGNQGANYQLLSGSAFGGALAQTPGAVVLDVRTPAEYVQGHIAGAVNLDIQGADFEAKVRSLDRDATYFVYCGSGRRSAQAVAIMKKAGISRIVELDGGITGSPELLEDLQ